MEGIRKPAVAGLFYPEEKEILQEQLNSLLGENIADFQCEKIYGLVVPHAGYLYSGRTAAYAYNTLKQGSFKTVVILAPSHREYFPGVSVFSGDAYETPLGEIKVNKNIVENITGRNRNIFSGLIGHGEHEHSLEVQLPFLQMLLKDFDLVPIVIGDQSQKYIDEISDILAEIHNKDILIVASSDLSHFHKKAEAKLLDSFIVERINAMDYEGLMSDLAESKCEACGGGPIAALMRSAKLNNYNHSKVLHTSDSGDVSGDNTGVVGYLSSVIYE